MKQSDDKRVFVFDFGKVLLDWDVRYLYRPYFTDGDSLEYFLNEIEFYGWNNQQDSQPSLNPGIAEQVRKYPHREELIRLYDESYPLSINGPIVGSVKILQQLYDQRWHLFGLSNFNSAKFASIMPQYPFFYYFEKIILSGDVGVNKPSPRIFEILLEQIARRASECIFIDDSLTNVHTAISMGFDAIHFISPEQLLVELNIRGFDLVL